MAQQGNKRVAPLAISNKMFAIMAAIGDGYDPFANLQKNRQRVAVQKAIDECGARRLIASDPQGRRSLTERGRELLKLRKLGEKRQEEQAAKRGLG